MQNEHLLNNCKAEGRVAHAYLLPHTVNVVKEQKTILVYVSNSSSIFTIWEDLQTIVGITPV